MDYNQEHFLGSEINLVQASTGKRFANYIIDTICYYVLVFILGMILGLVFPQYFDFVETSSGGELLDRIVWILIYGALMGLLEGVLKGKTPGKYITGTIAVNEDGSTISMSTAFKRGFIRMIPFCAFSALGSPCYPWQDKWTNTYVIDQKTSVLRQDV
ncbi:RDD family protein [Chitinophaga barathri]|uniref:RDD family protein n=1 Tax=Chitinophaga barathri TaxID=1647451 RepID=A0A3N4MFX2_9BACT|nr:RDD family protein [Chitinophaga barathri]RPD42932.1 RDD family protein [Chitinophaga barathri]